MTEGWTIAEFGRRSGFNKNHLSLIELAKNMPSLNMLFRARGDLPRRSRENSARGGVGATRPKGGAGGGDAGGGRN